MRYTDRYKIPLYEGGDAPDLMVGYNRGMEIVERQLARVDTESQARGVREFAPNATDRTLTQADLSKLKVTSAGIVYMEVE